MGRCWKCQTELKLKENEFHCDNCRKVMEYRCWNCLKSFAIRGENKKNIKECPTCGDYYCPHCNSCKETCEKHKWKNQILKILGGQTTIEGNLIIEKINLKLNQLVLLIETLRKREIPHHVCPYNVYSSYARGSSGKEGKIKQLLAKMNGIGTKSGEDAEQFKKKYSNILSLEEGQPPFNINGIREAGRYGQEERDACNLAICMGHLNATFHRNKKGALGLLYTRIKSKGKCQYLREDHYVKKWCPKCNRDYNNPNMSYYNSNYESCPTCIYKKGKLKGAKPLLQVKETNTFICNCPFKQFKKLGEEDDKPTEEE